MNIIEVAQSKSRREAWVDAKGQTHIIDEMNPHHLFNAVARLRRELARTSTWGEACAGYSNMTEDEVLSARVPAFDAMVKRLEEPYVRQFLLEGPHQHFEPKPLRARNRRFSWDEVERQLFACDDGRWGDN